MHVIKFTVAFAVEMELSESVTLYDSYQNVLDDARVNAVYIPLPTTLHLEWVTLAARAHKHVLLEKPVAINAAEFKQMMDVCRENGVMLMDGTMYMHHK
jgi:predicted dehydrogenase